MAIVVAELPVSDAPIGDAPVTADDEFVPAEQQAELQQQREAAREYAKGCLARREYARKELQIRLLQKGFDRDVIRPLLDEMQARQWLSDERYAEVMVRHRFKQGYGSQRIAAELQQFDVDAKPELASIDEALWCDSARAQRCKRFGMQLPENVAKRAKQQRYLYNRGFTAAQVRAAMSPSD